MFLPALEAMEAQEFVFQVGKPIGSVSLWARQNTDDGAVEFPIFSNTRGQEVWNSMDADVSNQDEREPTDAFWNALADISGPDAPVRVDVDDCEWYEVEAIRSLINMLEQEAVTSEMGDLLAHAEQEVEG